MDGDLGDGGASAADRGGVRGNAGVFGARPQGPASRLRRQVGEAALAAEQGFELGKLLVAPMVAPALNQLVRRGEVDNQDRPYPVRCAPP
jgi:hypothetical protein